MKLPDTLIGELVLITLLSKISWRSSDAIYQMALRVTGIDLDFLYGDYIAGYFELSYIPNPHGEVPILGAGQRVNTSYISEYEILAIKDLPLHI